METCDVILLLRPPYLSLSVHETPEWFSGLENVAGVSIRKVVSNERVKYHFWVNNPFNLCFYLWIHLFNKSHHIAWMCMNAKFLHWMRDIY